MFLSAWKTGLPFLFPTGHKPAGHGMLKKTLFFKEKTEVDFQGSFPKAPGGKPETEHGFLHHKEVKLHCSSQSLGILGVWSPHRFCWCRAPGGWPGWRWTLGGWTGRCRECSASAGLGSWTVAVPGFHGKKKNPFGITNNTQTPQTPHLPQQNSTLPMGFLGRRSHSWQG